MSCSNTNINHLSFVLILLSTITSGCAHSPSRMKTVLKVPAKVYGSDTEPYAVKAEEAFELQSPVSRIESEGYQPLVVTVLTDDIVQRSQENPVEIKLKSVEDWKSANTEAYIVKQMDSLYMDLFKILQLARSKQTAAAIGQVDQIIKSYPKLASAYYVKAQVEVLNGNTAKANETLNAALALKPEFKEAITLKQQLQNRGRQ